MKMSKPPLMYKNFEKVIATGGKSKTEEEIIEKEE